MRKSAFRIGWSGFGLVLVVGLCGASPAAAEERVPLQQKHTKEQVHAACDAVDGIKVEGAGTSKGYGCYNPSNGILVACTEGGDCMGFIPRSGIKVNRDLTILGRGRPQLQSDPFLEPKSLPPPRAPATRQTTPATPG